MAASTPKTILLEVNGAERPIYDNRVAAGAGIKPGMLVEIDSNGKITPVTDADKVNNRMFAVEASWADDATALAIDQTYDSGDNVRFFYAQPGDLVYALVGASQTVVIGSVLASSADDGLLTVEATNVGFNVVGIAEEAVTTGGGATARCKVRIL